MPVATSGVSVVGSVVRTGSVFHSALAVRSLVVSNTVGSPPGSGSLLTCEPAGTTQDVPASRV
ncbi:hypothetical protein B1H29_04645 [Streptomyces pactum]|uniref:Uncharacterized protein n=1 Tax=Streptomyces pactum TaxID=68249 RepID=A0A1S6J3I2_9ACTN|nr:hypothetical protein B1H29_04645 [Streptomyces pactum]